MYVLVISIQISNLKHACKLMKILDKRGKMEKNKGVRPAKLLLSQLLIAIENYSWHQNNAKT